MASPACEILIQVMKPCAAHSYNTEKMIRQGHFTTRGTWDLSANPSQPTASDIAARRVELALHGIDGWFRVEQRRERANNERRGTASTSAQGREEVRWNAGRRNRPNYDR